MNDELREAARIAGETAATARTRSDKAECLVDAALNFLECFLDGRAEIVIDHRNGATLIRLAHHPKISAGVHAEEEAV